ncbi:MAG: phenylalanine--tRNA ligase subunit alpha [Chlamydiae bacterium]|nr:phenylalanine--tRNA ligase subunit alpha [Chlamydiota bacterium]
MFSQIDQLLKQFQEEIRQLEGSKGLEAVKIAYLGKKGSIAKLMADLRLFPDDEKKEFGKKVNDLKDHVTKVVEELELVLEKKELDLKLHQETLDITLPGKKISTGKKHILYQTMDEMISILSSMGFSVQYSPELDSEYYNYGGLNYPEDHPARDMQDTYYISKELLMRSHTTNFQLHLMQKSAPPLRVVCPGKCYRNETISTRSHVIFHQIDALYIDKNVTFRDLLSVKEEFYSKVFNQKVEIRVRPSYFPFVEPGFEVDVKCTSCHGAGCRLCKQTGWLEVSGAGMVHPEVLKQGGIDPEVYSGYAWGGGVERVCMLKHGIQDIRLFLDNDLRFLNQF